MHPLAVAAVLAAALALLAVTAISYRSAQASLLREANRLYSSHALTVDGDLERALQRARTDHLDVQLYRVLSDDGTVRAVISTRGDLSEIPSHDVAWPVSDDRPGALVGSDIARAETPITAEDRTYPVAGRLGLRDHSLVADEILIYDPALFVGAGREDFVIDGRDAPTLAALVGNPRPAAGAFNRRTNVDFVSPIIVTLASVALVIGAAVSGRLVFGRGRRRDEVERIWGRSRAAVLARRLATSCAVWAIVFAGAGVVLGLGSPPPSDLALFLSASALLLIVFAVAFSVSSLTRRRAF